MKTWVKVLLFLTALLLLAAGSVYYVLVNKLEDVLTYAVEQETKGDYVFRSKAIKLSIWDKTITIDGLSLSQKDTVGVSIYYDVNIPKAYLSIESWQELLINKRLAIDSFAVVTPDVAIHDYRVHPPSLNRTSFHLSAILDKLQNVLNHLHAKSFRVQGAALSLYHRRSMAPFVVKDLTISIRNFSKIDNDDRRLLGADAIELAVGRQHWVLSDGGNTLSFGGLRFSSASQLVELDSIHFYKPETDREGETSLRAEQFSFNSRHLPAIYQKGELWLDTLTCVGPVLTLPIQRKKTRARDTGNTIHANIKALFKTVNVRYTQIKDGQLLVGSKVNAKGSGGTQKANLTIHNLTFHSQKEHPLTIDSIYLNLKNIAFFSPDSLFKFSIGSFALRDRDALFRNVLYGPASHRITGKGMTFTAPLLQLHNISFEDLMQKRLVASAAKLVRPGISIQATQKPPTAPTRMVVATAPPKKVDLFKSLHSLGQLLQVGNFQIIDANVHYSLAGDKPMNVVMKKMSATVLLNDFLVSNALNDLKHAIPELRVADAQVTTANKLNVRLTNYTLDGKRRHNWVDKLQMALPGGLAVTARKLYWEAFAWDALQQSKDIQIELLRVQDVAIDVKPGVKKTDVSVPIEPGAASHSERPLPKLHIAQLMVGRVNLKAMLPKQTLASFQGSSIRVNTLTTDATHFRWATISGQLNGLNLSQPGGMQISVANVALNSQQTTTLTNLHYVGNKPENSIQLFVPQIRVNGPFSSTNFSTIQLQSLNVDRPELTMVLERKSSEPVPGKAFAIPGTFAVDEVGISGARVNLTTKNDSQSTRVETVVDVAGQALHGTRHESLTFASLHVTPADIKLTSPNLKATVSSATVQLTNGKLEANKDGNPSLTAHLLANWTINDLRPPLATKNGTAPSKLSIGHVAGSIDLPAFQWTAGQKLDWMPWVDHTNLTLSDVSFRSTTTVLKAEKVAWEPKNARLWIGEFSVVPTETKTAFMAPTRTQGDYITVKGDGAILSGIETARWHNDSTLVVNHVKLTNLVTTISRDKRLPMPTGSAEKWMPTRLIDRIKLPLHIDSVSLVNAELTYHELSKVTNRESHIPLRGLNGRVKNITNRHTTTSDSLMLIADTKLLDLHISRLRYHESYADSLSGFHLLLKTSGMHLPGLNPITNPMAAADVDDGFVEPITARIAGNKYASVGTMHFYYKDLKVRLLDHRDTSRKSLLINFENFIINRVLRKKNRQDSRIFFARNRHDFIFSYWIKSIMSGILTSVGVKGNKRYHTNYLKMRQQHAIPAEQ